MIYGIAEELIRLSIKHGFDNLCKSWGGSTSDEKNKRYATLFSPTIFSVLLDKFVIDNGVKIRFDTYATYPVMEEKHCKGVICESVGGREFFEGKIVIDATGDASICHRAGIPTVLGENYLSYVSHYLDFNGIKKYTEDKKLYDLRKWCSIGSDLYGNGHPENMAKLKCETADDVTDYMIICKMMLYEKFRNKEKNSFDIMSLPNMPQYRTIRRIVGNTDFNAIPDIVYADSIGVCGDFRPKGVGKHYSIPYGALYNPQFDNILACGRIISAPQGDGWEVARVIPTCALTGEGAGKAAAVAIEENISVCDVNAKELFE